MFSIIIPTYNCRSVLSNAIDSIIKQSFKHFEILCIDGQSNDGTIELLQQYSEITDQIKYISEPDKGIYDAMNKGIKMAKGDWLYFLGSDDTFYTEQTLEHINEFINKNYCDVVYGDISSERFNGRRSGNFLPEDLVYKNICHQGIFFHKNIFSKIGLFNLKYKAHADWDHNMRWFLNPNISKYYIPLIIAQYADNGFSSANGDPIFDQEKDSKIIKYGWRTLPRNITLSSCKRTIQNHSSKPSKKAQAFAYGIMIKLLTKTL